MRTFFSFTWQILRDTAQLLIVLFVFANLHERFETIVVAILGLIYITIRGGIMLNGLTLARYGEALDKEFVRLRTLLNDETLATHEPAEIKLKVYVKILVEVFFLSLISLACLFQLFTSL